MKHISTDIVIVGAGLAGLYTALNIDSRKRIDVIVELNEENYYNLDNTHLALLERLKTIDDQIKKLESDEKYIRGVETSNLVQNHLNNIDSICGFKDDPQITSDEWEKMRELGK